MTNLYIFHPRIRGADDPSRPSGRASCLSSPHTRGKRFGREKKTDDLPFIPACTGQTCAGCVDLARVIFHPRTRGADQESLFNSPEISFHPTCTAAFLVAQPRSRMPYQRNSSNTPPGLTQLIPSNMASASSNGL